MENQKIGFMEEAPNQKSATRLIFIWGSFWAMMICSYAMYKGMSAGDIVTMFISIMGVLSGTKLMQKNMEVKDANSPSA